MTTPTRSICTRTAITASRPSSLPAQSSSKLNSTLLACAAFCRRKRRTMPNNKPTHPPITQTELAALFELGEARDAWAISIRHRLAAGVQVEPGAYVADHD